MDWILQFQDGEFYFFKSENTQILDEKFGDVNSIIIDFEHKILIKIIEECQTHFDDFLIFEDLYSELDCLLGYSKAVFQYGLSRPKFGEKMVLRNMKHLMQQNCETNDYASYIPNDTHR